MKRTMSSTLTLKLKTAVLVVMTALVAWPGSSRANETDQFLLPTDRKLEDVGPVISRAHYDVLEAYVTKTNKNIRDAKLDPDPKSRDYALEQLHSPMSPASYVRAEFGPGFFETLELENVLRSHAARSVYGKGLTAYKTSHWIYSSVHLPFDPRKIPLSVPSSTINVYGHYIGTDKMGHFHDLGQIYFRDYFNLCETGVAKDEALRRVVANYARGPISEAGSIGFFATGVFSNGDLAANYLGFKFYKNLTQPVMLEGRMHPPLLIRIGDYWALNDYVRPESDFFKAYVDDHMNEALNPCVYEWGAAGPVAKKLRENADQILTVYADEHRNKRPREWFEQKEIQLSTYYGEDYGHSKPGETTVSIVNCCFDNADQTDKADSSG